MKVHNIHLRLTGFPKGIQHLVRFLKQWPDCRVVEESYLIRNRNSPFSRKYVTLLVVEEEDTLESCTSSDTVSE